MKKRTLSLLLAVCMVLQLCSSMAFATTPERNVTFPISGKCGMSLTWTLDADGTMTISGSGDMFDYSFDEDNEVIPYRETPWLDFAEDIQKIVIEEGVMTIGTYAFSYLDNLMTVEVAASVTQVASNAFHSFAGTVPCNVLFLGDAPAISSTAVSECYNLRCIFMEDKLGWDTLLEPTDYYYANVNWFGMDENGIIEEGTCDENLSWTISADGTLTISGSGKLVWGIWPMAAYTTLIIEEGITSIGDYAFCMLGNLKKVTIPSTVTAIGERAFDECYRIREITFKGDAPAMHEYAFNYAGYYDGTIAYYPEDNATWTEDVRQNYGGTLTWLALPMDDIEDGGEDNTGGDIGTGGTIEPEGITWTLNDDGTILTIEGTGPMEDYVFDEETYSANTPWAEAAWDITEVIIGDGITHIGDYALYGMGGLKKLTLGQSTVSIGEGVFSSAYRLTEIVVPDGNTHFCVAEYILYSGDRTELIYCMPINGRTACDVPDTVRRIGSYAFANVDIMEIDLPLGLEEIGDHVFYYKSLTEIVLPESLVTIGDYAFYGNSFMYLTIPDSVVSIGEYAFSGNYNLEYLSIGSGLRDLGDCAFSEDSALSRLQVSSDNTAFYTDGCALLTIDGEELLFYLAPTPDDIYVIPDTVTTIADSAFMGSQNLCTIILPDGLEVIGNRAFYYLRHLVKAELPDSVTYLGDYAFGNTALTEVTIPDGVETIGASAFAYAPVTTATIGSGVTTIEERAFSGCTKLTEITFRGNAPTSVGSLAFSSVRATAYYPAGNDTWPPFIESYSDYDTHLTWTPVATETPDTTAPIITDVWPATDDNVTLCHDDTLQVAATDETALDYAEVFDGDVLIGSANFNASGIASIDWNCADHVGEVTLTYVVYDKAGNSAEQTAIVTVRRYEAPKTPENLTVENGFRSGTLRWSYSGDLQTLKQFNIYDGDSDMLVTSVKAYQHTFRDMTEACTYKVAAVDIYGNQSFSTEAVTVTPILTENVAPKAVMQLNGLTGLTGKSINFSATGSSDNDAIAAYAWDFGDGATGEGLNAAHTYANAGTYTVTLTVTDRSGNTDAAQASVTILDTIGENATHAVLTVTVQDGYAENTPGVAGATVTVYNDSFELAALTKADGRAELVVPKGSYTMTVMASGYDGEVRQIEVTETGVCTLYLAQTGVDVVGGKLTVQPMTREEIEEAGIDMDDPANNHVVKQSTTIRFQPMPELQFELPIEQILNAAGDLLQGTGFGWHTFKPDPGQLGPGFSPDPDDPDNPDDPEGDEDEDEDVKIIPIEDWVTPNYDVGVFPVGDSAFMVIYGQTHWLKEMFNVELIVFNNSYVDDITDCTAALQLPEGLSLANLIDRVQTETVRLGTLAHKGGETDVVRQVGWYVRGDEEGDYRLTAAVNGYMAGAPFEKTFTTDESIHVYAGSALKLIVTMPRSAYADQDYVVRFSLNNVSDKPIYNLTFGIDTAQQFTAERMSDGSTGEVEREYSNEDFEGGMTYGLPTLEPGKAFNLILKTTFEYEHQFLEWAVGKVPLGAVEVGYQVADAFVTTLEGSTTEIPVEIVLEDVKKDDLFQWIWDETVGAFKDGVKDKVIEFVDDKIFQGIPVAEKGVEIFEVVTNIKDEITEEDAQYIPTVNVTEGVQCVPKNEVDDWLAAFDTYSLRRSAAPGILVWTDAADAVISADGRSMQLPSGGKLYTLRLGETAVTPEIDVTTYYVDADGSVQPFTRTLTTEEAYASGLQNAKHILLEPLAENTFEIPAEGETLEVSFDGYLISEDHEVLLRAANEKWSIAGESTDGLTVMDGTLVIGSEARAGTYTVQLALEGTDQTFTQTIVLTGGHRCAWDYTWQDNTLVRTCSCGEGGECVTLSYDSNGIFIALGTMPEDILLYTAAYAEGGQMIDGLPLHTPYAYAYPNAEVIRTFVLDQSGVPILPIKELR